MATSLSSTPSSSSHLGSVSPSVSVICEEVFDEACQPSSDEIQEYAQLIGIDPDRETYLLYLAKEGLMQALPDNWKICYSEEKCGHYYYNLKTKKSQWDHPLDEVYRQLVKEARHRHENSVSGNGGNATIVVTNSITTPLVDNSEDASQLDSGIRSLQGTDEWDNTNTNTNEMSSPSTAANLNTGAVRKQLMSYSNTTNNSNNTTTTINSCGANSSLMSMRMKSFHSGSFMPLKSIRSEMINMLTSTGTSGVSNGASSGNINNHELSKFSLRLNSGGIRNKSGDEILTETPVDLNGATAKNLDCNKVLLKTRRQMEMGLHQAAAILTNPQSINVIVESVAGTPSGMKSILRDSSLTDIRKRQPQDEYHQDNPSNIVTNSNSNTSVIFAPTSVSNTNVVNEDKKSVRFNLETEQRTVVCSPDDEMSSSKRTPEISGSSDDDIDGPGEEEDPFADDGEDVHLINRDLIKVKNKVSENISNKNKKVNDDAENEDEDDDDQEEMNDCVGFGSLPLEGLNYRRNSNPFLVRDELKPHSQIILAPVQNPPILKGKLTLNLPDSLSNSSIKAPYEDTDSESKGSSVRSFIINKSEQDSVASNGPENGETFDLEELGRRHSRDLEQLEKKLQSSTLQNTEKPSSSIKGNNSKTNNNNNNKNHTLPCTFKMASKLVGFFNKDNDSNKQQQQQQQQQQQLLNRKKKTATSIKDNYEQQKLENEHENDEQKLPQYWINKERKNCEDILENNTEQLKLEYEQKLKSLRHEYDLRLTTHRHQMDERLELELKQYRQELDTDLELKRTEVVKEHKSKMATLQQNHTEILADLERDLKSEKEILRREHATKLQEMREQLQHELDLERQKMRENGDDRQYEKIRCEKRLLEDKYRCLKEKYIRLKTDVKLSLERRNRRREAQQMQQQMQCSGGKNEETSHHRHHNSVNNNNNINNNNNTNNTTTTTGSETERSISNKPSNGNSENRSLSYSSMGAETPKTTATTGKNNNNNNNNIINSNYNTKGSKKPPVPSKAHLQIPLSKESRESKNLTGDKINRTIVGTEEQRSYRKESNEQNVYRKPNIASKYIRQLQQQDGNDTTSISQSDTTISNNYIRGRGRSNSHLKSNTSNLLAMDNGNSDSETFQKSNQENCQNNNNTQHYYYHSNDNDHDHDHEHCHGHCNGGEAAAQRKRQFSRLKSASTSRLNSNNYKPTEHRPCTPVENLRHQLQKLEDLEDQFPENTLDSTYHLRYPFSDISNADRAAAVGTSSELEFFKHRIHLERDSVRRAKESLRTQRTDFRSRQREIKQRHKSMIVHHHALDQLIQEEKDLTEMEVNLHRTRALLGEKVIRLRHLEQSLLRMYEKEKSSPIELLAGTSNGTTGAIISTDSKDEGATLSDLSSHSSSGFSSTDFVSAGDTQNIHQKRRELPLALESSECIKNLEILNAEIKEILELLGKTGHHEELSWSHILSAGALSTSPGILNQQHQQQQQHLNLVTASLSPSSNIHSIPTLADRLEAYRQMANGRMLHTNHLLAANTIVSQNPRALSYTTSLVERTRDLRNWLRQARNEHELLSSMHSTLGLSANTGMIATSNLNVTASGIVSGISGGSTGVGIGGAVTTTTTLGSASGIGNTNQTNL